MKVTLLEDVYETDNLGRKTVKVASRPGRDPVPFVKGRVIEMSAMTAAKYIARGQAALYEESNASNSGEAVATDQAAS